MRATCLTAWLVSLFLFPVVIAQERVTITTGEYPPAYSAYSPYFGYTNHIVAEAFAEVGVAVDFQFMPWNRAYQRARIGRTAATCCWFYTADRQAHFQASDEVIREGFYFYHLTSFEFDWNSLEDLSTLRIGGTREYSYTDAFYQAVDNRMLTVEWVNSDLQSLRKLLAGRIDIVPIDTMVGAELLRSHFSEDEQARFTYHEKPLLESATHLLIPRSSGEAGLALLERFNQGLQRLKDSGRYDDILDAAYSGHYQRQATPWQPPLNP